MANRKRWRKQELLRGRWALTCSERVNQEWETWDISHWNLKKAGEIWKQQDKDRKEVSCIKITHTHTHTSNRNVFTSPIKKKNIYIFENLWLPLVISLLFLLYLFLFLSYFPSVTYDPDLVKANYNSVCKYCGDITGGHKCQSSVVCVMCSRLLCPYLVCFLSLFNVIMS